MTAIMKLLEDFVHVQTPNLRKKKKCADRFFLYSSTVLVDLGHDSFIREQKYIFFLFKNDDSSFKINYQNNNFHEKS